MPLTTDRFDPATSGRTDPDRYLILGFDTEYQRYVDQPERRLENASDVSTHGTDLGKLIREDFWLIVTIMESR